MDCGMAAAELFPDDPHSTRSLSRRERTRAWRGRWYGLPPVLRKQLRDAFGNYREKYYRSYQPADEDVCFLQEAGMQYFVKQERKLLSQIRVEPYLAAGKVAMESFGAALTGEHAMEHTKITFVSIDFEGTVVHKGITEFGLAMINLGHAPSSHEHRHINSVNYKVKNRGKPKFMFGNTIRISPEILPRTIIENFSELDNDDAQRKVILIGHGLHNGLRILDDLGVSLEDLPVTGIVDTCDLACDVLGAMASLEQLLVLLSIPARLDLLHCASNDAHYTLQAFLALLQLRYPDSTYRLDRLARQELRSPPTDNVKCESNDWADHLDIDGGQLRPEG
jgi:hypothetical protein